MSSFYLFLLVIVFLILGPWFWRYKIRPRMARSEHMAFLQNHPEKLQIEKAERFLKTLYRQINAAAISHRERKRHSLMEDAYVYGEIDFLSFMFLLEKVRPQEGEIFYDLGSGSGKAVFTAALRYDFSKVYGVERLPGLHKLAEAQSSKALTLVNLSKDLVSAYLRRIKNIRFINDDFLNQDITDADIVFINATCLGFYTWEAIVEKLKFLKKGSRIIVTTKKIPHADFTLLYQGFELMSWGLNSVNIYLKQ